MTRPLREEFDGLQKRALVVGVVAAVAAIAGGVADPLQFYRSYLVAWLFWLGLGLGSLAIVMLHRMTGGSWGFAIRRLLESGMRTLPLLAILFVPIAVGMDRIYPWTDAAAVASDPLLAHKAPYLNSAFFLARAAIFFAVWIGSAALMLRLSHKNDRTGDPRHEKRARLFSGPLVGVYGVTMTLAAVDWAMSLEPHWFSTMYGVIFVVGQALSTLAFAIVASSWLHKREPFRRWLSADHFHDLGNLMFAFVLLWAYTTFSQFLIIWSGNVSEETPWYLARTRGGWQGAALALALFHFVLPFLLLLWRRIKRNTSILPWVALLLLAMRFVDVFWLVAPAFHPEGLVVHWLDVVVPIAIGGFWVAFFVQNLKGRPLLSLQDAKLEAMLEQPRQA
ncbi:MAG TPA: hypothetical protein VGR31_09410 [Planctomycetota bacterium]|jgi:hypothetical protein|nr:hypothetical protein [Planctomycetota bacterium]